MKAKFVKTDTMRGMMTAMKLENSTVLITPKPVDFEFAGESNGDMLWKLSDFGQK